VSVLNKKKHEVLLNKYPKIFAQYTLPPSRTAMCWGLECGEGWYPMIDALCSDIQRYIDNTPGVEQIEATQVKQKFGTLRFYYGPYNKVLDELIWEACSKSGEICECCGSTEDIEMTKGWVQPLCPKCMKKYMERK